MHPSDTILAVASPPGRSLRGIVRISGDDTLALLQPHLFDTEKHLPLIKSGPRRGLHFAVLDLLPAPLPLLALLFPDARSYTGQPSAELILPGNPVLLERVIDALIASGQSRGITARRAEPGEFTARSFFAGRLTLTQAEGVASIIAARSDAELRAAHMLKEGGLGRRAHALADDLAAALALVEAGIDFTDQEDVVPIAPPELRKRLDVMIQSIDRELAHAIGSEQLEAIPQVVIIGAPNAGKSTLFNALLRRERAVVSSVAGTTRDVLAEPLTIETNHGEAEVMLIDLAGHDTDVAALNQRMQQVARETIDRADLIVRCVPMQDVTPAQDAISAQDVIPAQAGIQTPAHTITIRTKADLAPPECATLDPESITVSAVTGMGVDALREVIADRLQDRAVSLAADQSVLRPRHEAALRSALEHLVCAQSHVESPEAHALMEPELIAASMRSALDELAGLAGDISPDDILGRVFATFCVGK